MISTSFGPSRRHRNLRTIALAGTALTAIAVAGPAHAATYDEAAARRLWEESERLVDAALAA